MMDLGTTDFNIAIPSMPRREFEKYSTRLFDEWDEYVEITLALPDYSLLLEVEEGSIIGKGKIAALVGALYIGISNYGSFTSGNDDASLIDRSVFYSSSSNFKPHVVDEIAGRLGIKKLIDEVADSKKLRARFGVSTRKDAIDSLRGRLDEFYDRRNSIVHSLNSTSGYAVNIVIDYTDLFEEVAESIKSVLEKTTAKW